MGHPATVGLSAASTAVGAFGAYSAQSAENSALLYKARLLDQNKERIEQQAREIERGGRAKAQRHRILTQKLIGQQRAAAAGSGVRVDAGSVGDITEQTARFGELDALDIEYNEYMRANQLEGRAASMGLQADIFRASRVSPWYSTVGSLLGGATRTASLLGDLDRSGK